MACTYDSAAQSNLVGTLALISEISTLRGVERVVHHQHRVPHSQPPASGIGRWHKLWGLSSSKELKVPTLQLSRQCSLKFPPLRRGDEP